LQKLQRQETEGLFTYSAVIVDNDVNKTAWDTVRNLQKTSVIKIDYYNEPEQNIALARNRAVENAKGHYIAFIDDDEFPVPDWLLNLYKTIYLFKSNGVLGPVRPHYPDSCPKWLIKSRLCERPEHITGTVLHWGETRTGNVLLEGKIFEKPDNRFGRDFGRTGGEDIEFFKKIIGAGKTIIWCNEAPAYETITPDRWNKQFYLQRSLRIGGLVGEKIRQRESFASGAYALSKSVAWIVTMVISLPFAYLLGDHLYIRALSKIMYNTGLIAGYIGRAIIRYRND
jgi:glycosyltransferase involved in cell wall biosynthesis